MVQARMARQLCVAEPDAALPAVVESDYVVVKGPADSVCLLEMYRKCPALMEKTMREFTENQKAVADARMTLVRGVIKLMEVGGMKRNSAVELIANGTRLGTLSPEMLYAASIANARKGSTRTGVGTSSLQRWLSDYLMARTSGERLVIMAPGKVRAKKAEQYPWMGRFLQYWRNPNRPSVTMAYEAFADDWQCEYAGNELMLAQLPKVDTVRYALNKLPKAERERGRITGAEYKSLLPFVRRDWSALPVNGAWVGDGHGIKMEVVHPATGWPFMAEITLVIDGCTRFVVGWSLALSENQVAVGDAIRHAVSRHGVPLIYYSDNGGGEKNKIFDADTTGIFSRLEVDHQTGIPGNPQARGIIERLNKETLARVAKKFGSYVGKSGDRETQRLYHRKARSAFNALSKGKELTAEQKKYMAKVPRWDELLEEIEVQVQRHNNRPHDSLPVRENGQHWTPQAYRNHLIKTENIVLDMLTSAELHEMFRPEVERIARRGEINLFNNRYFSEQLAQVEGKRCASALIFTIRIA
ncbi:DDE-type integrase/transposase/recombinase [Pantoea sp. Eser]|nr:DDE-type integrase/transposase/recombinase [Pantoea sp. Eser]